MDDSSIVSTLYHSHSHNKYSNMSLYGCSDQDQDEPYYKALNADTISVTASHTKSTFDRLVFLSLRKTKSKELFFLTTFAPLVAHGASYYSSSDNNNERMIYSGCALTWRKFKTLKRHSIGCFRRLLPRVRKFCFSMVVRTEDPRSFRFYRRGRGTQSNKHALSKHHLAAAVDDYIAKNSLVVIVSWKYSARTEFHLHY
jgi:hypothetical protein